jgi:hypothetical protein
MTRFKLWLAENGHEIPTTMQDEAKITALADEFAKRRLKVKGDLRRTTVHPTARALPYA